jgi:hypothetical protein
MGYTISLVTANFLWPYMSLLRKKKKNKGAYVNYPCKKKIQDFFDNCIKMKFFSVCGQGKIDCTYLLF